jgi:hypothetical protein
MDWRSVEEPWDLAIEIPDVKRYSKKRKRTSHFGPREVFPRENAFKQRF